MHTATWLHISDFHFRDSHEWAHDVVLSAMCKEIQRYCLEDGKIDFVLVTGDIAFAGKSHEYKKAALFFDEVVRVANIPSERIFCVPGNHDVDRTRQTMCFTGALTKLHSQNEIDSFFRTPEEVETLMQRQKAYKEFQETYFRKQRREVILGDLGYVSSLTVEDLAIAIVGINTSWLSHGGSKDYGKLLISERQIIDLLKIAGNIDVHIVIAMGHHPFHWLNEFDRSLVQRRIEESCQFFHCGHLHKPKVEVRSSINSGNSCLSVTAGATFESRQAQNSFCLVKLDILQAKQFVTVFQYNPNDGAFSYKNENMLPFTINSAESYELADLRNAIAAYDDDLIPVANYFAALLNEVQLEIPIKIGDIYTFGSFAVLRDHANDELKSATIDFMNLKNPMRLFAKQIAPKDFMTIYGETVLHYGKVLKNLGTAHPELQISLTERDSAARILFKVKPNSPFFHTLRLLKELALEHDWDTLHAQAERHVKSKEPSVSIESRRMLALALSQRSEESEKTKALAIYDQLVAEEEANATDFAILSSLLVESGDYERAKSSLLNAVDQFPDKKSAYVEIGLKIIEATGDRGFRKDLIDR